MTVEELKAEALRRLERDYGITGSNPRVRMDRVDDFVSFKSRYTMTLDGRPFVSWTCTVGYAEIRNHDVIWHLDEIGQPDLSFKGINKFKGRWEGETA